MTSECGLCHHTAAKYKCPSCQLHYCSIDCYKTHQNVHADNSGPTISHPAPIGLPPKPPPAAPRLNALDARLRSGDASNIFCVTDSQISSTEFQRLYIQYPRLQAQLREIYEATTEPSNDHLDDCAPSRGRGNRYRGRGRGQERGYRRGVGASESHEQGFKAGLHQLRKSRHLEGGDGEGLREFCRVMVSLNEKNTPNTAAN